MRGSPLSELVRGPVETYVRENWEEDDVETIEDCRPVCRDVRDVVLDTEPSSDSSTIAKAVGFALGEVGFKNSRVEHGVYEGQDTRLSHAWLLVRLDRKLVIFDAAPDFVRPDSDDEIVVLSQESPEWSNYTVVRG